MRSDTASERQSISPSSRILKQGAEEGRGSPKEKELTQSDRKTDRQIPETELDEKTPAGGGRGEAKVNYGQIPEQFPQEAFCDGSAILRRLGDLAPPTWSLYAFI